MTDDIERLDIEPMLQLGVRDLPLVTLYDDTYTLNIDFSMIEAIASAARKKHPPYTQLEGIAMLLDCLINTVEGGAIASFCDKPEGES